jgi:plastocyanin
MRRAILTCGALAAAALALVPATSALGGARAASSHTVRLERFSFQPSTLSIRRGDSVTWVWQNSREHNVTFSSFHSRTQVHGTYTVRFTRAGTFNYRCTIHVSEGMRGRILVH